MRQVDEPIDQDFLKSAFLYPEIRQRLQRGVHLDELRQIKRWLEDHRNDTYLQKEYGFIVSDLEFLSDTKSLGPPPARRGPFIQVQFHWVAVRGYYDVDNAFLTQEGIQSRWIINTMSVLSPILILDTEAHAIYRSLIRYASRNTPTSTILQQLLYLLYDSHVVGGVDDSYIRYVLRTRSYESDPRAQRSLEELTDAGKIVDDFKVVPRLVNSEYCVPSRTCISWDGWFHFLTLPTWSLSSLGSGKSSVDYTGNHIDGWDFFAVSDE
jgi:hypothetical protein